MRSILFIFVLISIPLLAQDREADSARFVFPETAAMRAKVAAYDSSRVGLENTMKQIDSLLVLADSVRRLEHPWTAAPTLRTWRHRFPQPTDTLLATWVEQASTLGDSAALLHLFEVQRNAVRVDSARGVIDTAHLPGQRVFRIRGFDSSFHYVQFENPHSAGDTIAVYLALFGRQIFISPQTKTGWDMFEGGTAPVGADSVFELYREVTRPRAYEVYDRYAKRFFALRAAMEPHMSVVLDSVRSGMGRYIQSLIARQVAIDTENSVLKYELSKKSWFLYALKQEPRDPLSAVSALEWVISLDSVYPGAATALRRVRHTIDSATRSVYIGESGRASMEMIPPGEVLLRSGERFKPGTFFIDRVPVSGKLYGLFEAATGYKSKVSWKNQFFRRGTTDTAAVHGMDAEDKFAFARWAGRRPATPQEIEYVATGGFETLALRKQHAAVENFYHVETDEEGFSCVKELRELSGVEQETLGQEAQHKAKSIQEKIYAIK